MSKSRNSRSLIGDLVRGGAAGAAGWWAMDQVLQFLYDHEAPTVRAAEDAARSGVPALEVMAESMAVRAGVTLSQAQREEGGTVLQWAVSIALGMAYGGLRNRAPSVGRGRGVAFGAGVSLVVDEGLIPLLGFAPGPTAFPWQTHARGIIGHLVYGMVTDAAFSVLNGKARPRRT